MSAGTSAGPRGTRRRHRSLLPPPRAHQWCQGRSTRSSWPSPCPSQTPRSGSWSGPAARVRALSGDVGHGNTVVQRACVCMCARACVGGRGGEERASGNGSSGGRQRAARALPWGRRAGRSCPHQSLRPGPPPWGGPAGGRDGAGGQFRCAYKGARRRGGGKYQLHRQEAGVCGMRSVRKARLHSVLRSPGVSGLAASVMGGRNAPGGAGVIPARAACGVR